MGWRNVGSQPDYDRAQDDRQGLMGSRSQGRNRTIDMSRRTLAVLTVLVAMTAACSQSPSDPIDDLVSGAEQGLRQIEDPDQEQGGVGNLFHRQGCPLWDASAPAGAEAGIGFGNQYVVCGIEIDEVENSGLLLMAELVNESRGSSIESFWNEVGSDRDLRDLPPAEIDGASIAGRCWNRRDGVGESDGTETCGAEFRRGDLWLTLVAAGEGGKDLPDRLGRQLPSVLEQLAKLEQ